MTKRNEHKGIQKETFDEGSQNLQGMPKENPFQVPDGFFEEQQARIKERVFADHQQGVIRSVFRNPKYVIAFAGIAATVILLISIFNRSDLDGTEQLSDITLEQLMEEDPEYLYSMDELEMIDVLFTNSDFSASDVFGMDENQDSGTDQETMIDYLIEEEISTESLYN